MHIVGLRRLTIAPLLADSETELRYCAPIRLARTAISVTRGPEVKGSEYFDTRGELVRLGGGRPGEMAVRFAEANEEALALILGAQIDANGVIMSGGGLRPLPLARPLSSDSILERPLPLARPGSSDSILEWPLPLAGPTPLCFALGFEAFATKGEDITSAALEAEESCRRACAYEKTWLYKCRARMGRYAREGMSAAPKAAHVELIVTPLSTRRRFAGDSLLAARLPPGAASAGADWFGEVYIPEERVWTN